MGAFLFLILLAFILDIIQSKKYLSNNLKNTKNVESINIDKIKRMFNKMFVDKFNKTNDTYKYEEEKDESNQKLNNSTSSINNKDSSLKLNSGIYSMALCNIFCEAIIVSINK